MEAPEQPFDAPLTGRDVGTYRIESLIGRGGMGEVYRAWDGKLERTVAVKILRGSLGDSEIARKRFVRETRLACQVIHPYVAMVLDVVEHGRDVFLVMEYIDGRRLDEVVRREKPEPQEIARYGLEIAEALRAIHDAGLIHRDLKPGNVMVTPAGHVKVLDFGVARRQIDLETTLGTETEAPVDSQLTPAGAAVGTVRYMSPEQLMGRRVDFHSDLFSLGVILYEAIAREHPFARDTPHELVQAILNDSPGRGDEPETITRTGQLGLVVNRLLEKDPDKRFDTVEDVVTALRAVVQGSTPVAAPRAVGRRRFGIGMAVATGLALLVGFLGFQAWQRTRAPSPGVPMRPSIAVLPFEDEIGDADGHVRAGMLSNLLGARLAESRYVRALEDERVREVVGRAASRAAMLDGIVHGCSPEWIVAGGLWREGDNYQARLDIYSRDVASGPVNSFRVEAASTAALVELAAFRLLGAIRPEGADDESDRSMTSVSDSDEANLYLYRARLAMRELRYATAISLFEKATDADSQFAAAHVGLAGALDQAGYGTRARDAAARAQRILERTDEPLKRLRLEAVALDARIRRDDDANLQARRALAENYADEPAVQLALGAALALRGNHGEALPIVDRAIALDPLAPRAYLERARVLESLGRTEASRSALDEAATRFTEIGAVAGRGEVEHARGDLAFSIPDYAEARTLYGNAARYFEQAGLEVLSARAGQAAADCDLMLGRTAVAQSQYDRVLPVFRAAGNYATIVNALNSVGAQLYMRGVMDEAEMTLNRALEEGRELENPTLLVNPSLNLGGLLAYVGKLGQGRALVEEGLSLSRQAANPAAEAMALSLLASIDGQQGRLSDAARSYRDLLAMQESPSGSRDQIGSTLSGLAEVLEAMGSIGDALTFAERGVEHERSLKRSDQLAYRLYMRALVRRHVADWAGVEADLNEARAIARTDEEKLGDLLPRLDLVQGLTSLLQGDWSTAERFLAEARKAGEASDAVALEVPALTASCEQMIRTGNAEEAIPLCRRALEHPRSQVAERTDARATLARALAAANRIPDALAEAQRALDEAETYEQALVAARAGALLVELAPSGQVADRARARGLKMLERYLESIDLQRRPLVRSRPDVMELISTLEKPADGRPDRGETG